MGFILENMDPITILSIRGFDAVQRADQPKTQVSRSVCFILICLRKWNFEPLSGWLQGWSFLCFEFLREKTISNVGTSLC